MAFKIAEAFVRLFVDRAELKKGLSEGKADLESFGEQAKEFASEIGSEIGNLILGGGLAAAVVELGKSAFEGAAGLHTLSQETGFSVEQLSKLQYAAAAPAEEFQTAIRTFNDRIVEAVQHGGQAEATFRSVGVSLHDLKTKSPYEVLLKTADAFERSADGAGKSTIASDLFSARTGTHLIPVLNKGSEGLRRLGDEAQRLGAVVGGDTAANAENMSKAIGDLKQILQGSVAAPVVAVLQGLAKTTYLVADGVALFALSLTTLGTVGFDLLSGKFSDMKKDFEEGEDTFNQLADNLSTTFDRINGVGEGADAAGKKGLQPLLDAIEQANAALAVGNVKLQAQGELLKHNAPAAEDLAEKAAKMEAAILIHQRLNPLLVQQKVTLEELIRQQTSLNATDEAGRKLNQSYLSERAELLGEVLAILLTSEESERLAAERTYEGKKLTLQNERHDRLKEAGDTIFDTIALQSRREQINADYDDLDLQNHNVYITKKLELDRKYGSTTSAIVDQLILKQKQSGVLIISAIDQIQSSIESNLGDALFAGIVNHIEDVKSAFKSLVQSILHDITNLMAQQLVRQFILSFLPTLFSGGATGGSGFITGSFAGSSATLGSTSSGFTGFSSSGFFVPAGPTSPTPSPIRGGIGSHGSVVVNIRNTVSPLELAAAVRPHVQPTRGEIENHFALSAQTGSTVDRTIRYYISNQ